MKPNMNSSSKSIYYMTALVLMCWVAQSFAQPTPTADNRNIKQKFDYLLKTCQEIPSGSPVVSAQNNLHVAGALSEYLREHNHRNVDYRLIRETLIEKPQHGEIKLVHNKYDSFDSFQYTPFIVGDRNGKVGYEGKDHALYLLEFEGKRYKLDINFVITESGDLTDVGVPSRCPSSKLIKLSSLPNPRRLA